MAGKKNANYINLVYHSAITISCISPFRGMWLKGSVKLCFSAMIWVHQNNQKSM